MQTLKLLHFQKSNILINNTKNLPTLEEAWSYLGQTLEEVNENRIIKSLTNNLNN